MENIIKAANGKSIYQDNFPKIGTRRVDNVEKKVNNFNEGERERGRGRKRVREGMFRQTYVFQCLLVDLFQLEYQN